MKKDEAEYIALNWMASWTGLNIRTDADFYDEIQESHLLRTKPNSKSKITDFKYHEANGEGREMISKVFDNEYVKIIRRLKK